MNIANILNILIFAVPLFWLGVILVSWFKTRELDLKLIKRGVLIVIALFILQGAYLTIATYNAWKLDPMSRYLLPPHNTWYFASYAYFHFWRPEVVNLFVGTIWAGFLFLINKFSQERFFEKSDIYLAFFTAFVVGWPKFFAYLAIAFGLLTLKGIINAIILKDKSRLALTTSIALSALVVAGFGNLIMKLQFFDNLKL
ncbi:MAG: hypothetical protein Q8N37_04820 [bacterium]|nr:hypothetical protein [bacterium]